MDDVTGLHPAPSKKPNSSPKVGNVVQQTGEDIEEMDGRPLAVYESRSRPEVSTATANTGSLELAGVSATLAGVSAVDLGRK